MGGPALLALAMALGVAGVLVLRLAWGRKARSWPLNGAGWASLLAGSVAAGFAEGAWGVSVMALATMAVACAALLLAAARAPAAKASASARRVRMLPEKGEPLRLLGRLATFVIVIVGGFAGSLVLSLALRAFGIALGWGEADANTLAFLAVPVVWGILATVLLMLPRRGGQLLALLVTALPAAPLLIGSLAA